MLQALERLSGPRRVLLGCSALLVAVSTLPWYHYSVRGLTFELSGWHEIGVLAWILAIDLLVWELVRAARIAPIGGDRGDRYSAVGGMATAFVGLLFVLRRGIDGDLGYAWMLGSILIAAVGWASWVLFLSSSGPAAIDARLGRGPAPEESRPDDGRPAPVRPAPAANWRRLEGPGGGPLTAAGGSAAGWSSGGRPPTDRAPAASLGLGPTRSASADADQQEGGRPGRDGAARVDGDRRGDGGGRVDAAVRADGPGGADGAGRRGAPRADARRRDDVAAWSSIDEPAAGRRAVDGGSRGRPTWNRPPEPPRDRADLPPWRGGPRTADPGGDRTRAWESAVQGEEDLPPWRRAQDPPASAPPPTRHRPRLPWRDRRAGGDGEELPPWRGGARRPDPPGGRPPWRDPGTAGRRSPEDQRPSVPEKQRREPPLW